MRPVVTLFCIGCALAAGVPSRSAWAQSQPPAQESHMSSSVAVPADAVKELTPTGALRAAINLGNPVLAQGSAETPRGITVDLARELASRLGVTLQLVPFQGAGKVFEALRHNAWDVAFLAIEPVRAAEIAFTRPYVLIEGVYLVPRDSPLQTIADVDRAGIRIGVNKGSAYDLFLSRSLKAATLVRSEDGIRSFREDRLDAAAGVKQPIVGYAQANPDTRVIPERFMQIRQAMGTPQGRPAAAAYLQDFIAEMTRSGFVAEALRRSGQAADVAE